MVLCCNLKCYRLNKILICLYSVNLSKVNHLPKRSEPNRIKYELKVRFGSIETNFKINWIWCIQVMKILNYVQLIDSVRSNRTFYQKNTKIIKKIRKISRTVRREKIELVRLSWVRFGSKIYLSSIIFTVYNFRKKLKF